MSLHLYFRYSSIPDEWEPPEPQPYKDLGNLRSWLLDTHCYDQYSLIYEGGDRTAILKNTHNEPSLIEERAVSTVLLLFRLWNYFDN